MQGVASITGLRGAMKAMAAAFPKNPVAQAQILTSTMRTAAAATIVVSAKAYAYNGDSSGALSESIGIRNRSRRRIAASRSVAGIEVTPIRYNKKAMALYSNFYGTTLKSFVGGIRHGHLIEFGTKRTAAKPFLWPAAAAQRGQYVKAFAGTIRRKIELAVKSAARRASKK